MTDAFVAPQVGFKPAGGIRTAQESLVWLTLMKEELGDEWLNPHLFRLGASSLLTDIERQVIKPTQCFTLSKPLYSGFRCDKLIITTHYGWKQTLFRECGVVTLVSCGEYDID